MAVLVPVGTTESPLHPLIRGILDFNRILSDQFVSSARSASRGASRDLFFPPPLSGRFHFTSLLKSKLTQESVNTKFRVKSNRNGNSQKNGVVRHSISSYFFQSKEVISLLWHFSCCLSYRLVFLISFIVRVVPKPLVWPPQILAATFAWLA